MKSTKLNDSPEELLNKAYKCKPAELNSLLEEIESAIKNCDNINKNLLRAKTVVTSKLAVHGK